MRGQPGFAEPRPYRPSAKDLEKKPLAGERIPRRETKQPLEGE